MALGTAGFTAAPCDPGEKEYICPDTNGDGTPEKKEDPNAYPKTKCKQIIYLKPGLKCGSPGLACTKDFNCPPPVAVEKGDQRSISTLAQVSAVLAAAKGPTCKLSGSTCAGGSAPAPKPTTPTTPATPTTPTVKSYTMAEVKAGNSAQKCWTAVSGKVYDLTPALTQHPGGKAAIMSLCGIDGTSAFTNQHGGQSNPMSMLNGLQIGILK